MSLFSPRYARAWMVFAVAVVLGVPTLGTRAWADEPRLEVAADQTITVVGTFGSLSELLTEICKQAGAELRAYDAPDRHVVANVEARPLSEAIDRLLANENYLLGMRGGHERGSPMQVAWVRVTGSKGKPLPVAKPKPVPAGSEQGKPVDSLQVQQSVADRLLGDETKIAAFLKVEPAAIAQSLRQYPDIAVLLRKLRDQQQYPAVVEKLDAVLAELEKRPSSADD